MLRTARCLASMVPLLSLAAPALAQRAATAQVDASRDQEARSLFNAGSAALHAGRFADALDYFERSYELSHRAALLYNIGVVASTIGRDDRAIEALQQFLREDPGTERRAEVDGRLQTLERHRQQQQQQHQQQPSGTGTPADGHGPGAGPWIVIGVSGASVVGGVVLLAVGLGANSTVESSTDWPAVSGDYDRGKLFTTLGAIVGAVGVAGAAAGVVWLVAGSGESGSEASVQVSAGLGGVSLGGTF